VIVDTTRLTIEEQVEEVLKEAKKVLAAESR